MNTTQVTGKEPKRGRNRRGTSKAVPAHYKAPVLDANGEVERTDDRPTPRDLFESFHAEFRFRVDTCGSAHNHKRPAFFDEARDGLAQDWARWEDCWCNPPYGAAIPFWITKALAESKRGATSLVLVPASTSTHWFRDLVLGKAAIRWIQSKIKFVGQKQCAPFHSMALVFGPDVKPTMSHMRKFKATNRFGDKRFDDRPINVWKHHDASGQLLFDPITAPGSWFNIEEQKQMDKEITGMFFGCRRSAGHWFWPGPPHQSHESILRGHQNKVEALRPVMFCFDGTYTPKGDIHYFPGASALTYIEQIDTTILAWHDQTIDSRPGSNSALIALGRQPLEALLDFANQRWPEVIERQPAPLEVMVTQEFKTLREAITALTDSWSLKSELKRENSLTCQTLSKMEKELEQND